MWSVSVMQMKIAQGSRFPSGPYFGRQVVFRQVYITIHLWLPMACSTKKIDLAIH